MVTHKQGFRGILGIIAGSFLMIGPSALASNTGDTWGALSSSADDWVEELMERPLKVSQGTQTDGEGSYVGRKSWQNPGGMWTPQLIASQAETLRALGLEIPAENLSNPASSTLQAVVSLGGCSGSFISPDGLVITNHHCAQGMLSYLSNQDRNNQVGEPTDFVKEGFHASARERERSAGPTERVFVTLALREVTREVTEGLLAVSSKVARGQMIEDRIKRLVSDEEASAPNIRAEVKSFYGDETFILIRKLEIKDVRLVFAPPAAVGYYGGDTDNWVWPRHTGDFSILRAYVAPDGSAREFHKDNVPYQPKNFLTVAASSASWLEVNDLVLVAGYPGRTNRLDTGSQVRDQIETEIPHLLEKYGSFRSLLQQLAESDAALKTKLEARMFSIDNVLKNRREALAALKEIDYLAEKMQQQEALQEWVAADSQRHAEWGDALEEMENLRQYYAMNHEGRDVDADIINHDVIAAAISLLRMAEERPKPDAERHPDFQERNWKRWKEGQISMQQRYDRRISKTVLQWKLQRALALPAVQWSSSLTRIVDREQALRDPGYIDSLLTSLYEGSSLEDLSSRLALFDQGSSEEFAASKDSVIKLALLLLPRFHEFEQRDKEMRGAFLHSRPAYIKALRAFTAAQGKLLAPDANSTLRITFGHVQGYLRPRTQRWQAPFTNLLDLHTKHVWGDKEFEAPANVLRALHQKDFSPYGEASFGNVPMNFLASVDTTGGNSGSAALNAKGELVGLLFDGNQDALYSDWVFKEDGVRSILVDIRYVLWYLDKVAKAKNLLAEMLPSR